MLEAELDLGIVDHLPHISNNCLLLALTKDAKESLVHIILLYIIIKVL